MKTPLLKLLSCLAAFGIASSAYSLTIVPTFDSSITSDPNAAQMEVSINTAIQVMESNVIDNVTVNITFVNDGSVGLGQSQTYGSDFNYSDYIAALKTAATSANDRLALSKLPSGPNDPVIGYNQIHLTTAQARVLALDSSYTGTDSTISFNMSLMNLTRPPGDPYKYDLISTAEHEMDEVLGISSDLPTTSEVWPVDLFRYTTNRVRTFTTSGDNAYFSIDGTNLIARYNMDPSGDYGDWWSITGVWAPPGVTPHAQVQDAFASPGDYQDLGVSELTALDVVGWTLSSTTPTLTIVHSGANQFTFSWPTTSSGFVLQERTNLVSGSWVFSSTGSTNPAVIVSTAGQKFYRLYKPETSSQSPAHNASVLSAAHGPYVVTTRVLHPAIP
jgi:hypothetical protein